MSAPDFADWISGQTTVAFEQQIYSPPSGGQAPPFTVGPINTAPYQSILALASGQASTYPSRCMIQVDDIQVDGAQTQRTYSWNESTQQASGDRGIALLLPIVSPSMKVAILQSESGSNVIARVYGSTRDVLTSISPTVNPGPLPLDLVVTDYSAPANTNNAVGYVGPYTNGFVVAFAGASGTEVNLYAAVNDAVSWSWNALGNVNGISAGQYATSNLLIPGMYCMATIKNNNSTADTCQLQIKGY